MNVTDVKTEVQLIDGVFTPSEAKDVINALIKEKINFHKIHRLSIWEGNEQNDTKFDDSRVAQLQREKENFQDVYREALSSGKRIKINGILDIEFVD